jgi:hypothetical protein
LGASSRNRFVIIAVGLFLGVGASAADSFQGFGSDFRPWVRVLSVTLNLIVLWVCIAFFAGRFASTSVRSALAGALALYAPAAGYYVFGGLFGDRGDVGVATLGGTALRWFAIATVAGPVFGVLGWISRRKRGGYAAILCLPVVALVEAIVVLKISIGGFTTDPLREWTVVSILGLMCLLAVLGSGSACRLGSGRSPRRPDSLAPGSDSH